MHLKRLPQSLTHSCFFFIHNGVGKETRNREKERAHKVKGEGGGKNENKNRVFG